MLKQLFVVCLIALSGCSSARLRPDPTPEHPLVACIADSPIPAAQISKRTGNRVLPELVRIIGVTTAEDGERWKVLRSGEQDKTKWQPWPREKIQIGLGCGKEAAAMMELYQFNNNAEN